MPQLRAWERIAGAVLAAALVGNGAFYVLVVQPLAEGHRGHQARLLNLQQRIRALQGQEKTLKAQIETLEEVETYWGQFPERDGIVQVTRELTGIADSLGLRMPGITYQPEPIKGVALLRVRLSLAVEGPYGGVRRFLHELEKRRQYLVVERMALTEQRGQAQSRQVAMQLSLAGYFR